ncbi:DUF1563 domain-containing protein [bacterium]|nr:DUF1563 domain-containing protein [bacterium]MBU1990362.1 DUF1563 domain-containing protein [bacterium]
MARTKQLFCTFLPYSLRQRFVYQYQKISKNGH